MVHREWWHVALLIQVVPMNVERCGASYVHSPHVWSEGDEEIHRCDGLLDVDDDDEEFDRG